jgi:D-serine deaminase-like pyridoxal phosphate-dependent protein
MIIKPTFLVDEKKCRANIQKIADKAKRNNVEFRAHFKTHQSLTIGRWFKDAGVNKITVSSLDMAKYFASEWNDITVAFPVNFLEIDTINELASKIQLNVVIVNLEAVDFLLANLTHSIGFFIKIDVGYKRTGVQPDNFELIDAILAKTKESEKLNFLGFLGHAGHSYKSSSYEEIEATHKESIAIILPFKEKYKADYPNLIISVGDTPTCSVVEDFSMVDEIRPGNFVFYDIQQASIGSNTNEEIAIAMACPIVAIHAEKNVMIMHGGGVHFAKDAFVDEKLGTIYGRVVKQTLEGWGEIIDGIYIKSLSQEHGVVHVSDELLSDYKVGDILYILPVHSCLTANCFKTYQLLTGEVVERF